MLQFDEEVFVWMCNDLQKICQIISNTAKKITQIKKQILKLLKDQKILKNQMIHYLEIIEIKQNICCRVTNCSPNPKEVGYRPNKPSTINL